MRASVRALQWMQRRNTTASELMKTARRVEQKRVAKHKKQQLEPNPYHKAQYISAYLEAKSAVISQHKAVARRHAETELVPLSPGSKELTVLSNELRSSYGRRPHRSSVTENGEDGTYLTHSPKRRKSQPVSFGDWREPIPSIQRELHSLDVRLHTIARGGLTPPSLSPEALSRSTAPLGKIIRPILDSIQKVDTNLDEVSVQNLARESVVLLNDLLNKGQLKSSDWSNIVSICVQQLFSRSSSWRVGYAFVEAYLQKPQEILGANHFFRDACQQLAVLAECIRFYNYGKDGPTLEEVTHLCQLAQAGPKKSLTSPAAAPLLSILYDASGTHKPASVHTFVKSYLLQRKGNLEYLHSSAWGEYVKAAHRFGASLTEIQALVDRCTDESTTANANQHLSSAHVWNAYLACSEASHALEVYQNNKAHYKLKGTSGTTAALMTSLAQAHTASRSKEALELFSVLLQRGDMAHYTAGTLVALLDNYRVLNDRTAFLDMALNFDAFFAPFGCREEAFTAAYHNVMHGASQTTEKDQDPELVRSLVQVMYEKHRGIIPKIVFDRWVSTYEDTTRTAKTSPPSQPPSTPSVFSDLTPEDLMDLL